MLPPFLDIKISPLSSQENDDIENCINNDIKTSSEEQPNIQLKYYKSLKDVLSHYKKLHSFNEESIYLLLLNIIKGNLTNLSLLFSLEVLNYLDTYCDDYIENEQEIDEKGVEYIEYINKKKKMKTNKRFKNKHKNKNLNFHFYYYDTPEVDNISNDIMENTNLSNIYDNDVLKQLYKDIDDNNISHSSSNDIQKEMKEKNNEMKNIPQNDNKELLFNNKSNIKQPDIPKLLNNEINISLLDTLNKSTNKISNENLYNTLYNSITHKSTQHINKTLLDPPDLSNDNITKYSTKLNSGNIFNVEHFNNLIQKVEDPTLKDEKKNEQGGKYIFLQNKSEFINNDKDDTKNDTMIKNEIDMYRNIDSWNNIAISKNVHPYQNNNTYKNTAGTKPYDNYKHHNIDDATVNFLNISGNDESHKTNKKANGKSKENDILTNSKNNKDRNVKKGNEDSNISMNDLMLNSKYFKNLCKKKKMMEKEKLKSIRELKKDLLKAKYTMFNKKSLFLNEENLKNIFESTFFDTKQMKNSIIQIISSYEIGHLSDLLNINMSNINSHFYKLKNVFLNKKKTLHYFKLNTNQYVIHKIENKLYSVFTLAWIHYTNYLRKILDIFSTKELYLLARKYYQLIHTNHDEYNLILLNTYGFTHVFMMYIILTYIGKNVYFITSNKSIHIKHEGLDNHNSIHIVQACNGSYIITTNKCVSDILSKNLLNNRKIHVGYDLNLYTTLTVGKKKKKKKIK